MADPPTARASSTAALTRSLRNPISCSPASTSDTVGSRSPLLSCRNTARASACPIVPPLRSGHWGTRWLSPRFHTLPLFLFRSADLLQHLSLPLPNSFCDLSSLAFHGLRCMAYQEAEQKMREREGEGESCGLHHVYASCPLAFFHPPHQLRPLMGSLSKEQMPRVDDGPEIDLTDRRNTTDVPVETRAGGGS